MSLRLSARSDFNIVFYLHVYISRRWRVYICTSSDRHASCRVWLLRNAWLTRIAFPDPFNDRAPREDRCISTLRSWHTKRNRCVRIACTGASTEGDSHADIFKHSECQTNMLDSHGPVSHRITLNVSYLCACVRHIYSFLLFALL